MEIQCDCGKFRAELTRFPENFPGRLVCYCDDCQAFLNYIQRADLMDANLGSEIIPAYPSEVKFISGAEVVQCVRLFPKGLFRFYTSCCKTPIANSDPKLPWVGFHRRMHDSKDKNRVENELGSVKCRVMGKFAKGNLPEGTSEKFDFKSLMAVLPFILKGVILRKSNPSPFFKNGKPLVTPKVLTAEERSLL